MELNTRIEQNILKAAEKVFYMKGKNGASMQDIADEAKITRTSLNYYYRSKDLLFEAVFRNTMEQFIPKVSELLNSGLPMTEYLSKMVEVIIDSMLEHPQIPVFVLQELTSNPDRIPQIWAEFGVHPAETLQRIKHDKNLGELGFDPRHLVMNVISMCIFPFAAKPLLVSLMFQGDEKAYIEAMKQRKVIIPMMINTIINTGKK